MTFKEWFYSASHRAKYTTDHPAYLAAQEAWEAAHEACAKVCESHKSENFPMIHNNAVVGCVFAIRARGQA